MDIERNNARFASFVKRMTSKLSIPLQSINGSQSWRNLKREDIKKERWKRKRSTNKQKLKIIEQYCAKCLIKCLKHNKEAKRKNRWDITNQTKRKSQMKLVLIIIPIYKSTCRFFRCCERAALQSVSSAIIAGVIPVCNFFPAGPKSSSSGAKILNEIINK